MESHGVALYKNFSGALTSPDLPGVIARYDITTPLLGAPTRYASLDVAASADYPITQVTLERPGTNIVINPETPLTTFARNYNFIITEGGNYALIVQDQSGRSTRAPFRIDTLRAFVCNDVAATHDEGEIFDLDNVICLEASAGLKRAVLRNLDGNSLVLDQSYSGQSAATLQPTPPLPNTGSWSLKVYDERLNIAESTLTLSTKTVFINGFPLSEFSQAEESAVKDLGADRIVPIAQFGLNSTGTVEPGQYDLVVASGLVSFVGQQYPIVTTRTFTSISLKLHTGRDANVQNEVSLAIGHVLLNSSGTITMPGVTLPQALVDRYCKVSVVLTQNYSVDVFPQDCVERAPSPNEHLCATGTYTSLGGPTSRPGATILGQSASFGSATTIKGVAAASGPQTVTLPAGVRLTLPTHGDLTITHYIKAVELITPARTYLPNDTAHRIKIQGNLEGPVSITINYSSAGLTSGQHGSLAIIQSSGAGNAAIEERITTSLTSGTIVGQTSDFPNAGAGLDFLVAAPVREYTLLDTDLVFQSNEPDVTKASVALNDPAIARSLTYIRSRGYKPIAPVYLMGPANKSFSPPAYIELKYAASAAAAAGLDPSQLKIFQFDADKNFADMTAYRNGSQVTGSVSQFNSYFALFGATNAVTGADDLAPSTTIQYIGQADTSQSTHHIATFTKVGFAASDRAEEGFITSGLDRTWYALNGGASSVYSGTFTLTTGTYSISFYSRDFAGNVESTKTVSVQVSSTPVVYDHLTGGALAMARDGSWRFWSVVQKQDVPLRLSRFSAQGSGQLSLELPGAGGEDGSWSVAFDGSGNVYAVGSSSGLHTKGLDISVYKVSPSGNLLSTAAFTVDSLSNDYALDASGDLWITGGYGPEEGDITLGLWHYDTSAGTLSLEGSYAGGGGFDAGFSVVADGSDVWVAGFTANSTTTLVDLALWRFASTGTLSSGPYLRPGFHSSFEAATARLLKTGDGLYVAASAQGPADVDLALVRFSASGQLLQDRRWSRDAGGDDFPGAMAAFDAGQVLVAGSALWGFDSGGALSAAYREASAGEVRDLAVVSGDIWAGVSASSAPRIYEGVTMAGTETVVYSTSVFGQIAPTSGTALSPFTISGQGFGAGGSGSRVLFEASTATTALWTNTAIAGAAPNLDAGLYEVKVRRPGPVSTIQIPAGTFEVPGLFGMMSAETGGSRLLGRHVRIAPTRRGPKRAGADQPETEKARAEKRARPEKKR